MLVLKESKKLRLITFFYMYVMQGIPSGYALTAIANYLAAENVSAIEIGKFVALISSPWGFQFLWGPVVDRFQGSSLGRRKPWIIFSQLIALFCTFYIFLLKEPMSQMNVLAIAFFIHGIFASLQDVSVDAMSIDIVPEDERGIVNALMRAGMIVGGAIGAAGMAYILRYYSFNYASLLQFFLLAIMTIYTFFIKEEKNNLYLPWSKKVNDNKLINNNSEYKNLKVYQLFKELFKGIFSKASLLTYFAIASVYLSESIFRRALNVHLIQKMHWLDTELSVLSGAAGTILALFGVTLGGYLSDKVGPRKSLIYMTIATAVFSILFNLLEPYWINKQIVAYGILIKQSIEPVFTVAAMHILMSLCRKGVEGSQYSIYQASINASEIFGAYLSGYLIASMSISTIGFICASITVLAFLFLYFTSEKEIHVHSNTAVE